MNDLIELQIGQTKTSIIEQFTCFELGLFLALSLFLFHYFRYWCCSGGICTAIRYISIDVFQKMTFTSLHSHEFVQPFACLLSKFQINVSGKCIPDAICHNINNRSNKTHHEINEKQLTIIAKLFASCFVGRKFISISLECALVSAVLQLLSVHSTVALSPRNWNIRYFRLINALYDAQHSR